MRFARGSVNNDRAERIQAKSNALIDQSGRVFKVVLPIIAVLLGVAIWLAVCIL